VIFRRRPREAVPPSVPWQVDTYAREYRRKRAWRFGALLSFGVASVAMVANTWLVANQRIVFGIVRVDNASGAVAAFLPLDRPDAGAVEELDRHWLWVYVTKREGYVPGVVRAEYNYAAWLSAPPMQQAMRAAWDSDTGPMATYGTHGRVEVRVNGISFDRLRRRDEPGRAWVDFTRTVTLKDGRQLRPQAVRATILYQYVGTPQGDNEDAVVAAFQNPFGFQVLDYQLNAVP
jgi:type IV secretory pathway component VirB8